MKDLSKETDNAGNKKRLQEGDIFYVRVNGKYVFGRILMDINERILKLEPQHVYSFYKGCYLLEVYKGICDEPNLVTTEIVLPGEFVFKKDFYAKQDKTDWHFYDSKPIDYKEMDFPETLETGDDGFLDFRKFDIALPTKTLYRNFYSDTFNQKYTGTIHFSYYSIVDEAFHIQGRDDLMHLKSCVYFSSDRNLRLQLDDRKKFYKQIGENINTSYYDMALKHGFDLARFY
jgi:hypothetical protein